MTRLNNKNCPPFLKWLGGKGAMLEEIKKYLPYSFHDYYEPFLGGGSVFFGLQERIHKAYLSDVNRGLINTYNTVKIYPNKIIDELKKITILHSKKFYYYIRDEARSRGMIEKASRFIYLNKAGFRGMYRVNKKGKFNVSYGNYPPERILQKTKILSCSLALQGTTITRQSYLSIKPQKNDFVFLDPPYFSEDKMFTEYTKDGFGIEEQEKLKQFFDTLTSKGVKAMIIHQDSSYIRKLYKDYTIIPVSVKRKISNGVKKNTSACDLIITNYIH